MSKLFGRFCEVSGLMCRVRLRNPPAPSPYTVKKTLRFFIYPGESARPCWEIHGPFQAHAQAWIATVLAS